MTSESKRNGQHVDQAGAGTGDRHPVDSRHHPAALVARGFAMGAADVVPGVSGGTMAFILGIYEELIVAIRAVGSAPVLRAVVRANVVDAARLVPWRFLAAVLLGIGMAVLSLARLLEAALERYPALLWAFFFGLVVASVAVVVRRVDSWNGGTGALCAMGMVAAFLLVGLVPTRTPDTIPILFVSGSAAICAMILPGVSGSFVLVLLGKYQTVLSAVNDREILTLGVVAAGAVAGLMAFSHVLAWLLRRYHDHTVAVLVGLMIGSLRKIWPWKEGVAFGSEGAIREVNVLPGWSPDVGLALGLAVAGFIVVVGMERLARRSD